MNSPRQTVEFAGRQLSVSNLEKVLYPASGFTKGEVINYYAAIAEVMLPHVVGRCVTTRRWPNGVNEDSFFQKNCPDHRPDWIETAEGPKHSTPVQYCVITEPAGLAWLANLAAIEVHLPMAKAASVSTPDFVVFDLDPGPGTDLANCASVALNVREVLKGLGLESFAKTSGQKGMQVYLPLNTGDADHESARDFAKAIGMILAEAEPEFITLDMAKAERPNKIFIDWSQNAMHKTTIGVYSLRPTPTPQVSTPLSWDEVEQAAEHKLDPVFGPSQVLDRVQALGDLFSPVLNTKQELPVTGK